MLGNELRSKGGLDDFEGSLLLCLPSKLYPFLKQKDQGGKMGNKGLKIVGEPQQTLHVLHPLWGLPLLQHLHFLLVHLPTLWQDVIAQEVNGGLHELVLLPFGEEVVRSQVLQDLLDKVQLVPHKGRTDEDIVQP